MLVEDEWRVQYVYKKYQKIVIQPLVGSAESNRRVGVTTARWSRATADCTGTGHLPPYQVAIISGYIAASAVVVVRKKKNTRGCKYR